jgi:hypothetical protein
MAQDDVLGQADALMRRHRSFVARPAEEVVSCPASDSFAEAPDIPLLTEVVDAQAVTSPDLPAVLDALHGEIDAALESWLADNLPASVAQASQQILAELDARARQSLLPRLQALIDAHRGTDA